MTAVLVGRARRQLDPHQGRVPALAGQVVHVPAQDGQEVDRSRLQETILDQHEGRRAKLYKITFELIGAESGKKAWIGDHEIKKLVTQDSATW